MVDGQLLQAFVNSRDEAAFEALVRRHGSMVFGVCRRIVGDPHQAEDAFQATFLVLARKAASVSPPEMVGNWLYGVARTTALRARMANAKRRVWEKQMTVLPEPARVQKDLPDDLQPLLDQELARLPDKYRVAIVLCDLEGRTRKEVARQLQLAEGTLSSRLTTARRMLAKRLTQRGLAVSDASLAMAVSHEAASAWVPMSLVSSTMKATSLLPVEAAAAGFLSSQVAALTEGVLKTMLVSKLKTVTGVLLVLGMVAFGGKLLTHETAAAPTNPAGRDRTFPAEAVPGAPVQRHEVPSPGSDPEQVGEISARDREGPAIRDGKPTAGQVGDRAADYDAIFYQVMAVVSDYFTVEYANRYDGRIETFPALVKPSRGEGTNGAPLRRRAMIQITAGDDGSFSIQVRVLKETERKVAKNEMNHRPTSAAGIWKPTGRDSDLEQVILKRLAAKQIKGERASEQSRDGSAPPRENRVRQYHIEFTLVKVDPTGRDFGEAGKGKLVAAPHLVVPEGTEGQFLSGGQVAVGRDGKGSIELLDVGVVVRVKVFGIGDGRMRVDTVLEKTELNGADEKGSQIRGNIIRSIARVKLGESVSLIDKDDRGRDRHGLRVRIVKEETIVTHTRSADKATTEKPEE
jgi:RNA polymerase sigma factor (sigma-70 family)